MRKNMTTVSVIIPYFQERAGILRRCLTSVFRQHLPSDVRLSIVVVDDGSPIPAQAEVRAFSVAHPFHMTIIEQPNAGVAAARNTGLSHVSAKTATYIAFLDSDDMWEPTHLMKAISALDQGYDFYFCDSKRVGRPSTFTAAESFSQHLMKHARNLGGSVHELDCESLVDQSLREHVVHTPTVVYRRSVAMALAFDASLRIAGEDNLFFFQLIQRCRRICCCSELMVNCADGVNIHESKHSWDDPGHLLRHMAQILAYYKFRDEVFLSTPNHDFVIHRIRKLRALFAFLTIRWFLKRREPWPQELRDMVHSDRRFTIWYPLYSLYVTACFPLRLYNPLKKW